MTKVAIVVAFLAASGCVVSTGDSTPPPVVVGPGRLTVRWTVSEAVDPNLCVLGRAAAIDITVTTTEGLFTGEYQAPCPQFGTTISSLYPGNYYADALLIDSVGLARTTVVEISPFTILAGSELIIDVDFPADSFLGGVRSRAVEQGEEAGARAIPSVSSGQPPLRASAKPISL